MKLMHLGKSMNLQVVSGETGKGKSGTWDLGGWSPETVTVCQSAAVVTCLLSLALPGERPLTNMSKESDSGVSCFSHGGSGEPGFKPPYLGPSSRRVHIFVQ